MSAIPFLIHLFVFRDKAGSYGIQGNNNNKKRASFHVFTVLLIFIGVGGTLVERIDGDFFTVMGLPLYRLSVALLELFDYQIEK